jgi:hypothetical protein
MTPEIVRSGIASTSEGYRSARRAIGAGMRAGKMGFQRALEIPGVAGDCDALKAKAIEFAQIFLQAEPELIGLLETPKNRRPPMYKDDARWTGAIYDFSEGGAYQMIEREWLNANCAEGRTRQMVRVMLPKSWGEWRRRSRCVRG